MSQKTTLTIGLVTQEAYQCIESFGLAPTTLQDYWYYGIVPVRQYFLQHGYKEYSREKCRSVLPVMQRTTNMDLSMSADIGRSGK